MGDIGDEARNDGGDGSGRMSLPVLLRRTSFRFAVMFAALMASPAAPRWRGVVRTMNSTRLGAPEPPGEGVSVSNMFYFLWLPALGGWESFENQPWMTGGIFENRRLLSR